MIEMEMSTTDGLWAPDLGDIRALRPDCTTWEQVDACRGAVARGTPEEASAALAEVLPAWREAAALA